MLGEDLTERALTEMRRQAGILGMTVQDNAKRASSIVGASFHHATFSDRIWMYQAQLRDELDSLLRSGLIQGYGPLELARHIDKLFDSGRYNAERLLRTELTRVQSDAQLQSFIANGFDEYQFNALGDACKDCAALDEQHFRVAEAMPGENCPPMHPNCRCAVSAYMDDESYNAWLDSYADHGMSFEEWRRRSNKTKQWRNGTGSAKINFKTGKMSTEEYAEYKRELANVSALKFKQITLPKDEYAHVMSELNNFMSDEDRKHALVTKAIGDYKYTIINRGFDNYTVVGKKAIDAQIDSAFDEVE